MSERKNVLLAKKSIENLCMEEELSCTFYPGEYPLMMTIKPYTGVGSQMSLLSNMENRCIAPNTVVTFICDADDGVIMKISDKYRASYDKFVKVKKAFDKLCEAWRELICYELVERGHLDKAELEDMYVSLEQ